MICYVDSSVVLRVLFGEPYLLKEWGKIERALSSRLLRVECYRTLDRIKFQHKIKSENISAYHLGLHKILFPITLIPINEAILTFSEASLPTALASLDSIHLSTALFWRERVKADFLFATHDQELALAAQAQGFEVIGV
ncbi:MAG: PIN domain-containing protein [Deltaproteobacteria bacterium]|nr:PIN domain-containing protein [Deltaproteobacteria bacterium]